ncbi:MAG: hypothetical protein JG761_378 [Proteiniphilum sp.]|jgi:hypothetical protein|nr:hypothetical protein [Proteiniphilum sp.]
MDLQVGGKVLFRYFTSLAAAAVGNVFPGEEIPYLPQEDDPCDDPDDDDN